MSEYQIVNGRLYDPVTNSVAVLVSRGYGGGWYTWAPKIVDPFDPTMVEYVLAGEIDLAISYAERTYPGAYTGGIYKLVVQWVTRGHRIRFEENDGYESIVSTYDDWLTA